MKRIIAGNSNCYHGYTIEEAIDGISAAGFHYIELTATKGWTEHVFPTMTFSYLNTIKDRLKAAGLVPFALSGHTNLMDTERIRRFCRQYAPGSLLWQRLHRVFDRRSTPQRQSRDLQRGSGAAYSRPGALSRGI